MKSSCIHHPEREPLIIIRQWQLEFCEGNRIAAALLSFFEYWHNIKLEMRGKNQQANDVAEGHHDPRTQDESLWQFHTEQELEDGILIFKRTAIGDAITFLAQKKVVTVGRNPNLRYKFDKTRFFLFHPEIINHWLQFQRVDIKNEKSDARQDGNDAAIPETSFETSTSSLSITRAHVHEENGEAIPLSEEPELPAAPNDHQVIPPRRERQVTQPSRAPLPVPKGQPDPDRWRTEPRQLRRVPVDEEGLPLKDDGYDKMDPFFLEIMGYLFGQPHNLQGRERKMWLYVYHRCNEDELFLNYIRYRLQNNPQKWHPGGLYRVACDTEHFEQWKRGDYIETYADLVAKLDRDLSEKELGQIGLKRVAVIPHAEMMALDPLLSVFCRESHLTPPHDTSAWLASLGELLELSGGNLDRAVAWMKQVMTYMTGEGLVIAAPKSILSLCRVVASGQQLAGDRSHISPVRSPEEIAAYRRSVKEYDDGA